MDPREKMFKWRQDRHITLRMLSDKSGIGEELLSMVEAGHVTHPKIAKKIQKLYGLTDEETYELMPTIHRPNHPDYNPNKYKVEVPPFTAGAVVPIKRDEVDNYLISKIAKHSNKYR